MQDRLPDTPWHVGYALKAKNDPRRHRSRCIYYDNKTKYCTTAKSPYIGRSCGGSAHCTAYAEKRTEEVVKREKEVKQRAKSIVSKMSFQIVGMDDKVEIKNLNNGELKKYRMIKVLDKPTEFTRLCLGHSVGHIFEVDGIRYKINSINDISNANRSECEKQVKKEVLRYEQNSLNGKYLSFKVIGYVGKLPRDVKQHNKCTYSIPVSDEDKEKRIPAILDQDTNTLYIMRNVFVKYKNLFQSK